MVTLTGTFTRLDGTPATGTVRVTPSRSPIMDPDGKIVISGPQVFPLDKDGKLTTEIPASDDPDLGPAFTYAVDVNLAHASWKISKVWIPYGSTTVDLSEIGDYQPVPGVATRVVTIPADGADGQVLVWDGAGFAWDYPPEGPEGPSGEIDGTVRVVNVMDRDYTLTAYSNWVSKYIDLIPGHKYYARRNYDGPVVNASGDIRAGDHIFIPGAVPVSRISTYTGVTSLGAMIYIFGVSGETHRYTDVILVDLTETFGPGNEPDLAYMDSLVRREGGWFDRSSPIVGNAFVEDVVTGPGMTLRHDTTVGTRVLLDHPGGTTMLHGDTGWRDVSDLLINGWTGSVHIRRVTNFVTLYLRYPSVALALTGNNATNSDFMPIPAGFGPIVPNGGNITSLRDLTGIGEGATLKRRYSAPHWCFSTGGRETYQGQYTFYTEDPWPTTLPGIPA